MKNYLKQQNIIIILNKILMLKKNKNDNIELKLIKEFLITIYKKFCAVINKGDDD